MNGNVIVHVFFFLLLSICIYCMSLYNAREKRRKVHTHIIWMLQLYLEFYFCIFSECWWEFCKRASQAFQLPVYARAIAITISFDIIPSMQCCYLCTFKIAISTARGGSVSSFCCLFFSFSFFTIIHFAHQWSVVKNIGRFTLHLAQKQFLKKI